MSNDLEEILIIAFSIVGVIIVMVVFFHIVRYILLKTPKEEKDTYTKEEVMELFMQCNADLKLCSKRRIKGWIEHYLR